MPAIIYVPLQEASGLLQNRLGVHMPNPDTYDAVPFMESILEDVFLGRTLNPDLSAVDILMMENITRYDAAAIYHEVTNTVMDLVTNFIPHLDGNATQCHFKVHDNMDLEITVPDRALVEPEVPVVDQFKVHVREEVQDSMDNGDYVPESVRRFVGC